MEWTVDKTIETSQYNTTQLNNTTNSLQNDHDVKLITF